MRNNQFLIAVLIAVLTISCSKSFESRVEESVNSQLAIYPESRLQDIYKNFYQDRFGPGHLIPDTASAAAYLRSELNSYAGFTENPIIEKIGWEGNYYRISLDIVKAEIITLEELTAYFAESANSAAKVTPEDWRREWGKIFRVIEKMNIMIPDFEEDKAKIDKVLESDDFAMHHSEAFDLAYYPHYRIVSKDIYEGKIEPFIN
ncbi:MAG: hypothetical protein LBR13_01470 [Dysgonamonadaceae bacterium]|jgi:hypothetical protein|nr:hypothetical protein [Dysgonamonadaceae bacterium]